MRAIDADALKEDLTRFYDNEVTARKLIDEQPTIQPEITHEQAVEYLQSTGWMREHDLQMMLDGVHRLTAQPEIIRCKDCKHWIPYDWMFSEVWRSKNMADYPEDEIGCNWCDMAMKADDFCSRGEKREVTT